MFRGSNDHLALRLRTMGMTVRQVVHCLWVLSALLAACAGFLVRLSEKRALIFVLFFFFVVLLFTFFVSSIQVDEGPKKIHENPFRIFLGPAPAHKDRRKAKRK
jgi:hypothetical protein